MPNHNETRKMQRHRVGQLIPGGSPMHYSHRVPTFDDDTFKERSRLDEAGKTEYINENRVEGRQTLHREAREGFKYLPTHRKNSNAIRGVPFTPLRHRQ